MTYTQFCDAIRVLIKTHSIDGDMARFNSIIALSHDFFGECGDIEMGPDSVVIEIGKSRIVIELQ